MSEQTAEHFPWHYTEFGVVCACGASMRNDETCPHENVNAADRCACGVTSVGAGHVAWPLACLPDPPGAPDPEATP